MLYPAIACALLYALWVHYLAIMALASNQTAALRVKGYALPVLASGLALDFLVNAFVFSVLCLELPKERTVSARVARLKREDAGWRGGFAADFCSRFLDPFDPSGCHCK